MEANTSANSFIAEKHGAYIAIGLIIYFFVMKMMDLLYVVEFRVFNFVIMVLGILMSIRTFKKEQPENFSYFKGLGQGVLTGIIGSLLFGLFVFFYVSFLDTALMQSIIENEPMGRFMNPYIVSVIIAVEGIASAMLVSFIIMNYSDPTKV